MESLGKYILSVIGAAVVVALLSEIPGKSSAHAALFRLAGGLFLVLTMAIPVTRMDFSNLSGFWADYAAMGEAAADIGTEQRDEALRSIIKSRTEAYILDKARTLQTEVTAEITLTDGEVPMPVSVELSGAVSPYAKAALAQMMESELGIAKENQLWIG